MLLCYRPSSSAACSLLRTFTVSRKSTWPTAGVIRDEECFPRMIFFVKTERLTDGDRCELARPATHLLA